MGVFTVLKVMFMRSQTNRVTWNQHLLHVSEGHEIYFGILIYFKNLLTWHILGVSAETHQRHPCSSLERWSEDKTQNTASKRTYRQMFKQRTPPCMGSNT